MARSVEEIKTAIKNEIRTYSSLDNFLFPEEGGSKASVFNTLIFVTAAVMFVFEVLVDDLINDVKTIRDQAPSGNASWLRRQILNFQLGDAITINTTDPDADNYFVPVYAVVDESKRIITRCAVKDTSTAGVVDVKVAKGVGSLSPLTTSEMTALENYYYGTTSSQGIGFAGVNANFVSLQADRLRVEATIYFLGQFVEGTVKANVITAINNYLSTFTDENFGGVVFVNKLVDAIQAVDGVSRVQLTDIKGRPNTTPLGSATTVSINGGTYQTAAGYIIGEDTTGNELTDTITMSEETSI